MANFDETEEFEALLKKYMKTLNDVSKKWRLMDSWEYVAANKEIGKDEIMTLTGLKIIEENGSLSSTIEAGRNKGVGEFYYKKSRAYLIALNLFKELVKGDIRDFELKKRWSIASIAPLHPELAKRMGHQIRMPQTREELELLMPLAAILNRDPKLGASYITTHYEEIMQKLQAFRDKSMAHELRKAVLLLSGKEADELNKCANDARKWTNYRFTNRIEFFTRRLSLYVKGASGELKDDIGNEDYPGLAAHFKDNELIERMFAIPAIKKLWTYSQEMEFFSWARYIVTKSIREEGKWEGFYEFYSNLRKGKKYIRMVKEKFGNIEFAGFLDSLHERIHENPEVWIRELGELNYRLNDYSYQNKHVIAPAQQALISLFTARAEELLRGRGNALNELRTVIAKRIKDLQNAKSAAKKRLAKLLRETRAKLREEFKNERQHFESLQKEIILAMPDFWEKFTSIISENDVVRYGVESYKTLGILARWSKFALKIENSIFTGREDAFKEFSTTRRLTALIFAEEKASKAAEREASIEQRIGLTYRQRLDILKDLISITNKIIMPKLEKLILEMNLRLARYIPETQNLIEGNIISNAIEMQHNKTKQEAQANSDLAYDAAA